MEISLSAGTIYYVDTGGSGPVVVLLHGLMMDGSLWDGVVDELARDHRCVVPALPLGAHRLPMASDVELSLPAVAQLVGELLDQLDLVDVTVVGNDTGGALVQLLMADGTDRIGQVVLASCDAFDNFPPGLTGRTLVRTGRLSPRLFGLFMQQMRLRMVRRLPLAFGRLTKRGDAVTKGWLQPVLTQAGVRRDTVRVCARSPPNLTCCSTWPSACPARPRIRPPATAPVVPRSAAHAWVGSHNDSSSGRSLWPEPSWS